ncbi:hypothetical protein ILUMI_11133, partial [Ignelater luminosus]
MPRPRRSNLSRQSRNARRIRNIANERTEEEQEIAREERCVSMARLRASQSQEQVDERAILAAKNKDVDDLNYIIQNEIIATIHSFKSIDCVTNEDEATNYPIEFLNSLDVPGLPPHKLRLKVGSVVIMLRNINQPKLWNGTRLV